jgi:linoleoyl-CoA desaturase
MFVYLLIGTHFCEQAQFPHADDDGVIEHDWASHALLTSLDWNPYSHVAHILAGGSNAHAAHHLFPNVSHAHYIALTRIIAVTAREYGLPHNVASFSHMVRSHFHFLKRMGKAEMVKSARAALNSAA